MGLRNKTTCQLRTYITAFFSLQFSSKYPEKILQIWLLLLSSRQANLFLGWLHCGWGCLAFKRLDFPVFHKPVPLCLGWHTLKSCVTWAQGIHVEKAALELCMLFFICTEETVLAQLCSHCKCCCFSILSINAAKFSLWSSTFFLWTASRMAVVSYTSLCFSFEKGTREETHNHTCARVTDSAVQTQILAGIKDTFKELIFSKWQEVWKYTATGGSLIFQSWRCEIRGKKNNPVF